MRKDRSTLLPRNADPLYLGGVMADTRTKEQRHRIMQAVRSENTRPEWEVRRLLHSLGYRYRLHRKDLPGKPDLVFPSRRKAIFVHGCFWHAHSCRYGRPPKSRLDYWLPKLHQNKKRDSQKSAQLETLGWDVLIIWQCETKDMDNLAVKLRDFLDDGSNTAKSYKTLMDRRGGGPRPIGIDLFAGAGGFSLGFESAGFDIAAAVEIDPIHCATHEFNFPYCTTICRSVLDITGTEIRRIAGIGKKDIAVVFGGTPCQGFSMIGKRAPDDPRNALVNHFVRLVIELQPAYFVFENVKGLTLGSQRDILEGMIEALDRAGYRVLLPYRILNAADYGIPQERHRLFLLGAKKGHTLPSYPNPCKEKVTVAEAIGDLPEADHFPELMKRDWVETSYGKPSVYTCRLRDMLKDPGNFGYPRVFERSLLTSSRRTEHREKSRRRFAEVPFGKVEPISRFHKLDPNGVCNTIRSGTARDRGAFTSPRPIHPHMPRCITNREAARLHSYPDWFRFHITKWHGFRQIGNSVPPLLAQTIASQIMTALGEMPYVPKKALNLGDPELLKLTHAKAAERYGYRTRAYLLTSDLNVEQKSKRPTRIETSTD